ncbi:hypothetical protein CGLO_16910 [Colletotrichum gloeosporioides Cg-14]|uniref:Uncharacterized protein n=1 Tax=Colletotrichum gloeosporioides (strain Cg-14) TaxID=1237896 RepID=T0JXX0_COLGC|nr:hypothetical protein CGLO_16910 [Colletotrichum gloeosporioides Cg-14]
MPSASANVHGNHQSGQYANTGSSPSYEGQSNRSSMASSASNTGARSLDRQPEERLDQEPSINIDALLQRLQSMTPESREEEFGQLAAAILKNLFDSSHWCKQKIQKSRNATETLLKAIIEHDRSEPSGTGRRACYYCFEMLREDRFGKDQPANAILKANGNYRPFNEKRKYPESTNIEPLRQFCMDCGVRLHFYRRCRRFVSETGAAWWACRCRVLRLVVDDENEPCPDCNCVCPLRNPDEDDDTFESDESDGSDP